MGTGIQLIAGILVLLWGAFVVAFPRVIIKAALAAEKAGLAWNPQARWGTGWIRMLGAGLGVVGLVIVVTALFGLSGAD
ncbi:amino acid permease [Curtobacterium pusillum]|uniref:Amino acid permease n=2 Tax=Curtobacterium pusillum TaxID=69373 RepID=A0AAW3T968_9MICO|nr:amino acid permease [Curtobacterium pusillum]